MDIQAIKNEILEAKKTFEADPKKITLLRSMSVREAQDYLFGEGDFAQDICCAHGIEITDYPDLRDCQHDLIYAHASE